MNVTTIDIGGKIKSLREMLKLTQSEFGEKLNSKKSTVCGWEKGESIPDIRLLLKMCEIFDIGMEYFLPNNKDYSDWILLASYAKDKNISSDKVRKLIEFLDSKDF